MIKYQFSNNLISFNKHNSSKKIPKIIDSLNSGEAIALVSDAGMPSICDPGEDLIKKARSIGLKIICIPGPCAALTALVSSGLSSSKFTFEGFLPRKKNEREKILSEICRNNKTTILFESPHRLRKLLLELKDFCGAKRQIQVHRELTKKFEEHIGDNIEEVINYFETKEILGEITVLIQGRKQIKGDCEIDKLKLKKELNDLINAGLSLSEASKYLAKKNNLAKSIIYNMH